MSDEPDAWMLADDTVQPAQTEAVSGEHWSRQQIVGTIIQAMAKANGRVQAVPAGEAADEILTILATSLFKHRESADRIEALEKDNHRLRKWRCDHDCLYTMGDLADVSGSHCPLGEPCTRCENERKIEDLQKQLREARKVLRPFAEAATIDEVLQKRDPNEFESLSPEQRIERIGENKKRHDANILAARAFLNGEQS